MIKRMVLAAMLACSVPASALVYVDNVGGDYGLKNYRAGDFNLKITFDRPTDATGANLYHIYFSELPYCDDNQAIPDCDLNENFFYEDTPLVQISPTEATASIYAYTRADLPRHYGIIGDYTVYLSLQLPDIDAHYRVTLTGESMVPEPATWAMMISGFGLVGVTVRRRRLAHADYTSPGSPTAQ